MMSLLVFFGLVAAAALVGSQFVPGPWYEDLQKPEWTPPSWLFGPVWTLLYIGIAIAGWQVWRARNAASPTVIVLWAIQLTLNGLWSWLFFGLRRPDLAFADIVALLLVIFWFIAAARNTNRMAALLFLPYALWVGFASALNYAIWRLNPNF
jgi:translocator protein